MDKAEGMLIASIWPSEVEIVDKTPSCSSTTETTVAVTQHLQNTPSLSKTGADGLLHIRKSLQARGISKAACNFLVVSWRPGTQK